MSRLAALIIGVAAAQPDIDAAACRRPTYADRHELHGMHALVFW